MKKIIFIVLLLSAIFVGFELLERIEVEKFEATEEINNVRLTINEKDVTQKVI